MNRRDEVFKALHKRIAPVWYYALDSDLVLVDKVSPDKAYPVALLEIKMGDEPITFTQAIHFNHLVSLPLPYRIPVYIVRALPPFVMPPKDMDNLAKDYCEQAYREHRFSVYGYVGADWRPDPPVVDTVCVLECASWSDIVDWEGELRRQRRREVVSFLDSG